MMLSGLKCYDEKRGSANRSVLYRWVSMTDAKNLLRCGTVVLVLMSASTGSRFVQGADERPATFSSVREARLREALRDVAAYIGENPTAADLQAARQWLFETALSYGLEHEALEAAQAYLASDSTAETVRQTAAQVAGLGLAKTGRLPDALEIFEQHLRSSRLRNPTAAVDFGLALVTESQLANNPEAATGILERLKDAFFLNTSVRQLCEDRLLKLQLLQQQAPEVSTTDLSGDAIDLADYRGKVVLVDFWATNCAPCLEEFPSIKQLYHEHSEAGFEIVGITLDTEPSVVDEFQKKWQLPWLLSFNESDEGQTRDRYRVRTIPSLFLVGRSGSIEFVDVRGAGLRRAVEVLLDEK